MLSNDILKHPMVTSENWENFTTEDHNTWQTLFLRQSEILRDRAADEVMEGMKRLDIAENRIPKFSDINNILREETGITIVPVKGFIPEDLFFRFLAERKFPSTCFIRRPDQMDYIEEPDIFHDLFGHIPLLANTAFADFMEEFGRKGLEAIDLGSLKEAAALYWFTIEFGLIASPKGPRIYGAGIISSKEESIYALDSSAPVRLKYDAKTAMHTEYRIDELQKTYFVASSFEELFCSLKDLDWRRMNGDSYDKSR